MRRSIILAIVFLLVGCGDGTTKLAFPIPSPSVTPKPELKPIAIPVHNPCPDGYKCL